MKRHPLVAAPVISLAKQYSESVCTLGHSSASSLAAAERADEAVWRALPARPTLIAVISAILLGACGGGNNDASTASTQPVSVPLQAAVTNEVANGETADFSVTGTIDNVPVTGTGTLTDSPPVVATFNGATVLKTTETVTDTVVDNGTATTVTETKAIFTNPDTSAEVGQINDDGTVDVITQIDPIPVSAPVGSSGVLGTGSEFSDASEQTTTGSVTETYTVGSGSGTSGTGTSGSGTSGSGTSGSGSSVGSGNANCDVVDVVKEVKDKNNNQIRKSERKTCVDSKGDSKFVSGEEQERNHGKNNDDFNENAQ